MGEVLLAMAQGVLQWFLIVAARFGAPMFWINYAKWLDLRLEAGREQ